MPVETAAKIDERASILDNREVAPGFWRMQLASPELAKRFRPGQFFQIRVGTGNTGPLLRRPFAPSEVTPDGFAFVYAIVGEGTEAMTRLPQGSTADVLGPLGNGYELPDDGRVLLVGGGCGAPSLRFVAETLTARDVEVYTVIGARTACSLLEKETLQAVSTMIAIATDDGSEGHHGHAVEAARILLDEIGDEPAPRIFACGPERMLKGLAAFAAERNLPCFVSLEERMACGFGACMGCAVAVKADNEDGFVYRRVCHDGPIFDARELAW